VESLLGDFRKQGKNAFVPERQAPILMPFDLEIFIRTAEPVFSPCVRLVALAFYRIPMAMQSVTNEHR
jgi:hypothetical protein